jgi:hypothetical protein
MFITLGFYKRRPDISREDFSCHWREIHGPLLRNTPSISRYLRRYVQHHLTPGVGFNNVMPLDCDGFSEAWFDTMQDRQAMHAEKEFQERVIPDEATFIDMSATRFLMFDNQVTQIGVDLMLQLSSNQN